MSNRREALKIMGAIGTTCAFPFPSNELYGQHVHPAAGPQTSYGPPKFFNPEQFAMISHLAELIIPRTDTPGAIDAGVPYYIDFVVNVNEDWRSLYRQGLEWMQGQKFQSLPEADQIALLATYLDKAGDDLPVRFMRAVKSMTADGYYTSKAGLVEDLGYKGNTVLAEFPSCEIPEH